MQVIAYKDSADIDEDSADFDEENQQSVSDTSSSSSDAAAAVMAEAALSVDENDRESDDGNAQSSHLRVHDADVSHGLTQSIRKKLLIREKIKLPHFAPPHPHATPQAPHTSVLMATKSPGETLKAVYGAGKYKAGLRLDILALQSFMAGIFIAMAGQLFLSVGGGVLGAAFFATGLIAVVLTSGELFTGDALIFVASLLGGQVRPISVLRNWTVSWCLNFAGCLAWAYVLGYCSDALQDLGKVEYAIAVAQKKAAQTWLGTFLKGIGANFMVCVGVWQATCAEEVSGKILALWFPITGFVAMGFDHCIANQFFLPLGMMMGADISVVHMLFGALLPATLGNIVGGGIFVGFVYWYVFDSMESFNAFRGKIRHGWNQRASMIRRRSASIFSRPAMSATMDHS